MYRPDAVYGLLPDGEAEDTRLDLEAHGVHPTEIDVHDPVPGRYRLADEYLHDDAHGALVGGRRGAGIGLIIGLLAATLLTSVTAFGLVGWVVMAFGGAGFGGLIGGMWGLQANEHADDDPVRWREVDGSAGMKVVEVHCLHWRNRAHEILARHGAAILEEPAPIGG